MEINGFPKEVFGARMVNLVGSVLEQGWELNLVNLAFRFTKPSCLPFYATWQLNPETGKWNFGDSRVYRNITYELGVQRLTMPDILKYAKDPGVIEPEERKQGPWSIR